MKVENESTHEENVEGQAQDAPEEQHEDEQAAVDPFDLSEAEQLENVEAILEDKSEQAEEQQPEETETDLAEIETEPEPAASEANQELIVNDELIEQFPELKSLKGKPITEVAKSYQNLVKEFTKRNQELAELKKQLESKPEEEAEDDQDELDDLFYENPTEAAKKLLERELELRERQKAAELERANQIQQEVVAGVGQRLPEGIDTPKAIQDYFQAHKDVIMQSNGDIKPEFAKAFSETPEIFYEAIANEAILRANKGKAKSEAYKMVKEGLSRAEQQAAKSVNVKRSIPVEPNDEQSKLVSNLFEMSYNPEDFPNGIAR